MIVVDSSALCAVFFNEPEKAAYQAIIDSDDRCLISAVNAHETACVLRGRLGQQAFLAFWQWLAGNLIEVAPLTSCKRARPRRHSTGMEKASIRKHASISPIARPTRWPRL
jgi:uncharacterized protein with PIN domain